MARNEHEIFYGQLQEILEFSYLNDFSVVLFKCKWFRCDSRRMVTENNITSINITSESYKDDQFILALQAQQVFYVEDPSRGPNWRVVQHVNHRSIWDITEDGMSDIDLLQDNSSSNFTLFVDLGNLPQINLQRNDGDVILIVQPFTTVSQHVNETASFLNDDDKRKFLRKMMRPLKSTRMKKQMRGMTLLILKKMMMIIVIVLAIQTKTYYRILQLILSFFTCKAKYLFWDRVSNFKLHNYE